MPSQRLFKLTTPHDWGASLDVLSGRFLSSDDPPFGLSWEELMEDLVFVSSESLGRGIDLGWYPDRSPDGQFVIQLVDLADLTGTYAKPIREFRTRSAWEAKRQMETLMRDLHCTNVEPDAPGNSRHA